MRAVDCLAGSIHYSLFTIGVVQATRRSRLWKSTKKGVHQLAVRCSTHYSLRHQLVGCVVYAYWVLLLTIGCSSLSGSADYWAQHREYRRMDRRTKKYICQSQLTIHSLFTHCPIGCRRRPISQDGSQTGSTQPPPYSNSRWNGSWRGRKRR